MILALLVALELGPEPRPGVVFAHPAGVVSLEHSLTAGLGSFPDLELRTALDWDAVAPLRPWLAYRLRRIALDGLPPVEDYLTVGVGMATDPARRVSLAGGVGLRFQLPPLAPEPAGDLKTYAVENVRPVLHFALRVRLW